MGLTKAGAGPAGFDFTKLDSNGQPLADGAASWDCVRDNVTGLVWEVKTDDNRLRDKDWTYTWCNNGGTCDTGSSVGSNNCSDPARCDTEKFVQDVNALNPKLCGFNDWRMPTLDQLRTIVNYATANPAIATGYFPRTVSNVYWSASPFAPNGGLAWIVNFSSGNGYANGKGYYGAVRLVRGGQ